MFTCFEEKLTGVAKVKRVFEGTAKIFEEKHLAPHSAVFLVAFVRVGPEKLKFDIDANPGFMGMDIISM